MQANNVRMPTLPFKRMLVPGEDTFDLATALQGDAEGALAKALLRLTRPDREDVEAGRRGERLRLWRSVLPMESISRFSASGKAARP